MKYFLLLLRTIGRILLAIIMGIVLVLAGTWIISTIQTPSLDGNWYPDVAVMPTVTISGDSVTIQNVRNNSYRTADDYDVQYLDKTLDLTDLDEMWFVIEPFSDYRGPAHTFVSFGFGGEYIAISVETRKEIGQHYNPLKGLMGNYELMYVIATEQDVVNLRANYRQDQVYMYPVNTTPELMREMFVSMVRRADQLGREPELYNTIYPNCTSAIWSHINALRDIHIPFSWKLILPSYSNEIAYDLDLIQNPDGLTLPQFQAQYYINPSASTCPQDDQFAQCIRSGLRSAQ